jgi:uncharacterized Zn finger protein (UPF0148 family)
VPIVTTEQITGLAHCSQQAEPGIRCAGYEQQEVPAIRETLSRTYADGWGGAPASDAFDATLADLVESTRSYVTFADEGDAPCPYCGVRREVTDQVRPVYQRLSESEPDELLRRQRATERAAVTTADAAERQAVALEQLVRQGERAGEVEQLREVIARQQEQLDRLLAAAEAEPANGHAKPRKRTEG